jgi:hypothetical protein
MSPNFYLRVGCISVMIFFANATVQASDLEPQRNNAVVLAATLAKLNLENPLKDLSANLKRGDKRFIGVNGYTCDAPGVTDADQRIVNSPKFGLNCLDGTSDVVGSDEHFRLIQKATDYAMAYNRELLRRIHAGLVKSS